MSARDAAAVNQLMDMIDSYLREIARQRRRLRSTWQTSSETVSRVQAQLQALDQAMAARRSALDEVMRNFTSRPRPPAATALACRLPTRCSG